MRTAPNPMSNLKLGFKRRVVWLAVAVLVWASGQGVVLSTVFHLSGNDAAGMWRCVMTPSGDMPLSHGGHRKSDAPADTDHRFCPICSLTGCGSATVTLIGEQKSFDARQFDAGAVFLAAQPPRAASPHQRPPARAPPVFV